jgi:hypothetical protein
MLTPSQVAVVCCCWLCLQVAYNLVYSLGQHTYDTDCNLFLRVRQAAVVLKGPLGFNRLESRQGNADCLRRALSMPTKRLMCTTKKELWHTYSIY